MWCVLRSDFYPFDARMMSMRSSKRYSEIIYWDTARQGEQNKKTL